MSNVPVGRAIIAIVVVAGLAAPLWAVPQSVQISSGDVSFRTSGGQWASFPDGSVIMQGEQKAPGWTASWNISFGAAGGGQLETSSPYPAVSINVNLTSNIPFTDEFEFLASIPSPYAFAAPTTVFGSSSVMLLDNVSSGDGASLAALAGDAVFKGSLNGAGLADMMTAPFTLDAAPYMTNSSGPHTFNIANGPAVNVGDTLQIRHKFTLTSFDTAQFVSTTVITPEPTSLLVLLVSGVILAHLNHRRH